MLGFSDILGHDAIKANLRKAIKLNKVSHAYMIAGEAGMGKKTFANAFALSLLCEKADANGCMSCHACKQVLSRNHPDCIYVTHEKPGSIGVEDIRKQINDTVSIRPYSSEYKVYIIDEAEKMTGQAQNALLKTMEEPPGYVVILLLTSNSEVFLPTVLSRCVQITLKPLEDSIIKEYLIQNMDIKEQEGDVYAAFARGNLGKAMNMASSEDFKLLHSELLFLLKNVKQMNISELLQYIRKLREEGINLNECLEFMQLWYRDVLMFKVTKDVNLLIFKDEYTVINEISKNSGYEGLENILSAIDKARIRLDANVNTELVLELMLLVMKEN
ncbi:MAG: DNA polymerase III subunit delta' [Lachnospiraceae bacterium]|jgi:DNA polymerase-3 subunit delta'|nr:DNA polymerase III subunit delta' [Lachnospiraceae bacterium]